MQLQLTTLTLALFATFATASPAPVPQSPVGGSYIAVGNKYSGPGCTAETLIFPDPIFGRGNVCQPLARSEGAVSIVSYNTYSVSAGCSVVLYASPDCTGTAFQAPVGGCVTGNAPFVSVFVTCTL